MMDKTNIDDFMGELAGGAYKEKLALVLSEAALKVATLDDGKKKGKVTCEFTISKVGEGDQVIIAHKLASNIPTKRGKKQEEDTTETPMFVGRGGVLTINAPEYNHNDQGNFSLVQKGN